MHQNDLAHTTPVLSDKSKRNIKPQNHMSYCEKMLIKILNGP